MLKLLALYFVLLTVPAVAIVVLLFAEPADNILSENPSPVSATPYSQSDIEETFESLYDSDDWNRYILDPGYSMLAEKDFLYHDDTINMLTYGSMNLNLNYGKSYFTNNKYRRYDEDEPQSRVINDGFYPEQLLLLHMEGTIGQRMTVYIDHDSRKDDNIYIIQYRAVNDDEFIREINAGHIDIEFEGSKYAVYDNISAKGMGVDARVRRENLEVKGFGSIARGISEVRTFNGASSPGNSSIAEFQYLSGRYYQLEPFIRYGGTDEINENHVVYESDNPDISLNPVNIDSSGFALYSDDQDPHFTGDSVEYEFGGEKGKYVRLRSGTDYIINYRTGLIELLKSVPERSRIFAVYNASEYSDPFIIDAGPWGFPGKKLVFLKYGTDINDAPVGNYSLERDIYEVRSFYYIGARNIKSDNLNINFFKENNLMSKNEITNIGNYSIDYNEGLIQFTLREPFRQILTERHAEPIYNERQPSNVYNFSRYSIRVDYHRDARSFQLGHFNIVPDSVRIKVNGVEISESLYSVDYSTGYIVFVDSNRPRITPETRIEVSYERMPVGGQTDEFTGGARAEYQFNRDLTVGGSVMYSGNTPGDVVPRIGSEPEYTLMLEGDVSMRAGPDRLARMYNFISGENRQRVPAELNLSGEIARSYTGVNTFGKALIDNMESAEELMSISLSEKDWVLSSRPDGYKEKDGGGFFNRKRSILDYYFYRNLSNTTRLRGINFNAQKIEYSVKPGPYNVAYGHIPGSIEQQSSQRSLVLDFREDTEDGEFASIVTRRLSDNLPVDMSSLEYIEISYKYEGTGNINLFFDLGKICEDSDGDGVLDTEDLNNNGVLDKGEDVGYSFNEDGHPGTIIGGGPRLNSSTMGDGVLNTEDLNRNGILDVRNVESVFTIPSESTIPDESASLLSPGGGWKRMRIYIDHNNSDAEILRQVESIRMYITKEGSVRGRLFIDDLKFASTTWGDPRHDDTEAGPDKLRTTMVNSINDSDYRENSFILNVPGAYKSLYGSRSSDELNRELETALQIEYGSEAGAYSVTRRFSSTIDIRHYGLMHMWMNFREYSAGDKVRVRLGSSENDYMEYEFDMSPAETWREIILALHESTSGKGITPVNIEGYPDFKRIRIIKLIIDAGGAVDTRKIWVNDMYVSDPETLSDNAHWYEAHLKISEPLFQTEAGVPVLSDIDLRYVKRGHGADFNTIGRVDREIAVDVHELYASTRIIPSLATSISYFREQTSSDPFDTELAQDRRGDSTMNTFYIDTDYVPASGPAPAINMSYRYRNYDNSVMSRLADYRVDENRNRNDHAPGVVLRKTYDDFLGGKLRTRFFYDGLFKDEAVKRESDDIGNETLADYVSLEDREKLQRGRGGLNFHYNRDKFHFSPSFSFDSEEVVYFTGDGISSTGINEEVRGGFHLPFIYSGDFKFTERNNRVEINSGLRDIYIFSPEYRVNFMYGENRFKDRTDEEMFSEDYPRIKDTRATAGTSINVPIKLNIFEIFNKIRFFVINYSRSLFLSETGAPYEGESKGYFKEDYGISRVFSNLNTEAYNLFTYHPGYFFRGRGNYAEGRDKVYSVLNREPSIDGEPVYPDYNNRFRFVEQFSFNASIEFDPVRIFTDAGMYQSTERRNVQGLPVQIVTRTMNVTINTDLMKILDFGFFRSNISGKAHHSSFFDAGYSYTENMMITSNIEEKIHSPSVGLTFKRNRSRLSFEGRIDMRFKNDKEYISYDENRRSSKDDIYIENMPEYYSFHEKDYGHTYIVQYETDVGWMYNYFAGFYDLVASPVFTSEFMVSLDRYDYYEALSPEPYDLYMISTGLNLDLHENIQGGFSARMALERFRDREDNSIVQEIFSYELGFRFTILF